MTDQGTEGNVELQKLTLERARLQLQREQLDVETLKALWGAVAIVVPLLAILATVALGVWGQYRKSQDDFALKMVEIIMNTDDPIVMINKARYLAKILGNRLPADLQRFANPNVEVPPSQLDVHRAKMEFLRLLAANPSAKAEIVAFTRALFPDTAWLKKFESAIGQNSPPLRSAPDSRR
jgi:hypothetical protein